MKHVTLLVCAVGCATNASAQLINESFELNGAPTLEGWEWTCEVPGLVRGGAPGHGDWSATKEPGQTQGCFPSYLYQRVPRLLNGETRTLLGWVRCTGQVPLFCPEAAIGFGRVNNGFIQLEEDTGIISAQWTFVSIADTIELGPGDTAIVALNSGLVGGPVLAGVGNFDGITVLAPLGIGEHRAPLLAHRMDLVAGVLHLGSDAPLSGPVKVVDMSGRTLPVNVRRVSDTGLQVDVGHLPAGSYLAIALTEQGERAVRFTLW